MTHEPERPSVSDQHELTWGSDAIAQTLRDLDIEYISLNPGFSFRGLHDSLVNYLGNERPQILLCLHEEHAIGIAHGYAKVAEKPMAVAVHSNVGLMHATMGIFNAYCDRVPMLVIGATGPIDAVQRRPWIDWLHTAADQAALVRPFIKWDDQPGSAAAAVQSVIRGWMLGSTPPCGPVYVCLDTTVQEELLSTPTVPVDVSRFRRPLPSHAAPQLVREVADLIRRSKSAVILAGRVSRSEEAWQERVELAERTGARVFSHLKLGAAFPTDHPLHGAPPSTFPSPELCSALRQADVVLSLDWLDLGGTLDRAGRGESLGAAIVSVSVDQHLHHGWSKDHMSPAPSDLRALADPDSFVHRLLVDELRETTSHTVLAPNQRRRVGVSSVLDPAAPLSLVDIGVALDLATVDQPVTLIRVPNGWPGALWHFTTPLDFLGGDGGEGLGSGLGISIGAALALADTGRLPATILGDGDFLMGVNALWTAAHYRVPLLVVVANNNSFFLDELHQHHVAELRGRPVENRWVGQRIDDPPPDLAMLARAQGLVAYGPIVSRPDLATALRDAVGAVRLGATVVVDVRVMTETYAVEPPGIDR